MRGYKAKVLRKFAKERTQDKPDVMYRDVKYNRAVTYMDADGNPQKQVVDKVTRVMDVNCTRKYYKMLKGLEKSNG